MTKFILMYVMADNRGVQKINVLGIFNTELEANQNATQYITECIEDNDLDPDEAENGEYSIYNYYTGDHHKWEIIEVTI